MAYLLNKDVVAQCSHGGPAQPIAGNPRVKVGGAEVLTVATQFSVSGCSNNPTGTSPLPCVLGTFPAGATRVKVGGVPVLLDSGSATVVPTGASLTLANPQQRVKGQ
ncbi:MAG: hypothetical protein KF773_18850 [Deltaproteobacteria bacterium]|nr:hypothetical protein [Deltaproteobacteria bacterium]MCW5809016.1 hypothetical protein [Deltaproteobacteria bacterium]